MPKAGKHSRGHHETADSSDAGAQAEIQEDESSVIPNEPCFVVFSKRGFVKRLKSDTFATQKKGGRGAKCSLVLWHVKHMPRLLCSVKHHVVDLFQSCCQVSL